MKKILAALLALVASAAFGTTTVPVQLLNPTGSSSGQTIVSTGAASAPGWSTVGLSGLTAIASNTVVANATASSAAPAAFAMPSCSATGNALNWTTSTGFTCQTGLATLASPTFTGTPAAPTAAAGTSTTQIATTGFLVQPGPIGSTTANTGAFTTLNASGNDALNYSTATGQSIPNGTATTVTTWTKTFDRVNANFNASTGTFTAPATGQYQVSAQLVWAANTAAVNTAFVAYAVCNGSAVNAGVHYRETASSAITSVEVSAVCTLSSGQTIVIQAFQNSGGALSLITTGNETYVNINRLP